MVAKHASQRSGGAVRIGIGEKGRNDSRCRLAVIFPQKDLGSSAIVNVNLEMDIWSFGFWFANEEMQTPERGKYEARMQRSCKTKKF